MKAMGKIKGFLLNRKQYDRIRKMDHCQMTLYVESIYKSGYADGKKDAEGLTANEIREVLLQVKGIGEKRVDIIVSALEAAMNNKEDKKSDS
jgi:hypothetical protein